MRALKEIGILKAIKYLFYKIVEFVLAITIVPQIRTVILRLLGTSIGKNTIILNCRFMNLYRGSFKNLTIGDNCYIGSDVLLDLAGQILIGNNVTIAERSVILTHFNIGFKDHPLQKFYPSKTGKTIINSDTFIGIGSIVLLNVHIGTGSLIGAGSVVTKNVPANTVVGGIPAIKIKSLKNE